MVSWDAMETLPVDGLMVIACIGFPPEISAHLFQKKS
jgi:hypothetical protein